MFAKIFVGLLIGFVGGFVEGRAPFWRKKTEIISEVLIFFIGIAFLVSSFMFGAIYGLMAIAEISIGYFAYGKSISVRKDSLLVLCGQAALATECDMVEAVGMVCSLYLY